MTSTTKPCLYTTLGVSRDATADDIAKSFRKLAREHHPDKIAKNDKTEEEVRAATERFTAINHAHEVLSDPEKRARYDMFGHAGVEGGSDGGPAVDDMFDQMYGLPSSAAPSSKRPAGVLGGAMFVDDSHGSFFQRRLSSVEDAKREMTEGLPVVTCEASSSSYEASTSMPNGSWECRMVEVEPDRAALTITFGAAVEELDDAHRGSLRCVRTLELPADADVASSAVQVKVDEERSMLSLTVPKVRASSGVAVIDLDVKKGVAEDQSASTHSVEESTPPNTPPSSPRMARSRGKTAKRCPVGRSKRSTGFKAGFLNAKPRRVSFEEPGQSTDVDEGMAIATGAE